MAEAGKRQVKGHGASLSPSPLLDALAAHWPEYLMEAWGLGIFMVSAGLVVTALEHPASPLHRAIADADGRRALIGIAMGLTAVGIIYSPWGRQSGAHLNPAVTLSFLRLGKVRPADALFYALAQAVGGLLGVLLVVALLGRAFTEPPVVFVATLPGARGEWVAFAAEAAISALMMTTVLVVSNTTRYARWTGLCAGVLVALFIAFEAPLSGMSMNPARSLASAVPGALWSHLWIYLLAPPLGMLAAAQLYVALRSRAAVRCAKLDHAPDRRCIHCGYEPPKNSLPL